MVNKHIKRYFTSCHLGNADKPTRMPQIQNTDNTKSWCELEPQCLSFTPVGMKGTAPVEDSWAGPYKAEPPPVPATICQQNGQLRRNWQILRKAQPSKTEPGRNKIWIGQTQVQKLKLWFKNFQQAEVQDQMASLANSIKYLEKISYPSETIPKNCRGRNIPKLILWGHHHPDTKTRQKYHKKRKFQSNITDEHRCKNPQQSINTSQLNPTIH